MLRLQRSWTKSLATIRLGVLIIQTGINIFAVEATHKSATDEICEERTQMKIELGLVLEQFTKGVENFSDSG